MNQPLDIKSLHNAYSAGTLSPTQLVTMVHDRIEACGNEKIWIHCIPRAAALAFAATLEQRKAAGELLPLYGIPFAIKDNIDLAGVPTTAGCPEYAFTPAQSAPVVKKLIDAGAIPIGKTNLDQFATGLVGVRSPYGVPRNPLAPDRVPGGSSSGSAVALSESLVTFSLGTDTAGSGRVPAMFNRLWGVKPSKGRLSTSGVVPACRTLDCVSIFAFNAEDAMAVLAVAEGYDPTDPYSQKTLDRSVPQSQTLGIPSPEQLMFFGDAGYEEAWKDALKDLETQGWILKIIDFEPFLKAARLLYEGPWVSERFTALEKFLTDKPEAFFPATRSILSGGADHSARDVFAATYRLAELRRESEAIWEGLAAIVTPTAGGFPTLADLEADPIGPNSQLGYYTNFMNLLDLCAVAAPAGSGPTGLPFGLTWIAPRDTDRALLRIAAHGPDAAMTSESETLPLVLFGAHMRELPLNPQIVTLGAKFIGEVQTSAKYKMVHLPDPAPQRPGVLRVASGGVSITGELWEFPKNILGQFLSTIRQPLGLGEIELIDGRRCHGFLCEAAAADAAEDISSHGGWRAFLGYTAEHQVLGF